MRKLACAALLLFLFTKNGFSADPEAPVYLEQNQQKSAPTSLNELLRNTQSKAGAKVTFFEILNLIEERYYKSMDMNECIEKILTRGVSYCTDPYSFYLNGKNSNQEQDAFRGKFGGIGTTLSMQKGDKGPVIADVIKNTPAEKAGLRAGDVILAISTSTKNSEWIFLEGLALQTAVDLIRGEVGTAVKLKILRNNKETDFALLRAVVKIEFIESRKIGNVGYIRLVEFSGEDFVKDFYAAVERFSKEKVQVLILDVRNNPGGRLNYVMDIACPFTKECQEMIYHKSREGPYQNYQAQNNLSSVIESVKFNIIAGGFKNFKLIVLQNSYSASASEILASYLQSEAGATVIGLQSYGKGSIQSVLPLKTGGVLHLTIAEYFVGPKKIKINGIGVKPNIKVKNPTRIKTEAEDLQLQKALEVANQLLLQK